MYFDHTSNRGRILVEAATFAARVKLQDRTWKHDIKDLCKKFSDFLLSEDESASDEGIMHARLSSLNLAMTSFREHPHDINDIIHRAESIFEFLTKG